MKLFPFAICHELPQLVGGLGDGDRVVVGLVLHKSNTAMVDDDKKSRIKRTDNFKEDFLNDFFFFREATE